MNINNQLDKQTAIKIYFFKFHSYNVFDALMLNPNSTQSSFNVVCYIVLIHYQTYDILMKAIYLIFTEKTFINLFFQLLKNIYIYYYI